MSDNKKVDLSVILTAHNEGILAHKTMLSVFKSLEKLKPKGIEYEIIIHIDNGTRETKDYFERYRSDKRFRIFENSFGDPSLSRNFSVENSRGEYVSCFDADDLLTENWYSDAFDIVTEDDNNIARFNFIVTFGGWKTVITENVAFGEEEVLYLAESNLYGSPFMCRKSLYLKNPQRANQPPFAYEDWQWNLDIIAKGGKNVIVPKSAIFYRQDLLAKSSVLSRHNAQRSTLSPTRLLSFDYIKNRSDLDRYTVAPQAANMKKLPNFRKWLGEILYHTTIFLNNYRVFRAFKRLLGLKRPGSVSVPDWLINEWKKINKIEKQTAPSHHAMNNLISWLPNITAGIDYVKINKQLSKKPDTIFFMPWMRRGGADKVFINTANEVAKIHPKWSVAVFQTLIDDSPWRNKLARGVDFVDFAKVVSDLDYESQLRLLAMFISQNEVKRLVICNSKLAYDFLLRYKTLVRRLDIKVYAYAFAGIVDDRGLVSGYVHEELPLAQDVVYKIITDNSEISKQLHEEHAIDKNKFYTHYQYLDNKFNPPVRRTGSKIKILWASRIARTKLPELARDIAGRLETDKYTVDVYGSLEDDYGLSLFKGTNLNYKRRFDGVDDLPVGDYDIFLYTSNTDGMPNMLLEIGSKGIPIIAPNIGGIRDFIQNGKTGLLIEDCYSVEDYVLAIHKLSDSSLRHRLATGAQEILRKRFSRSSWERGVKEIFDK